MEFRFEGAVADVMPGIQPLDELGVELEEDGIPVEVALSDGDLEVGRDRDHTYIRFGRKHQFSGDSACWFNTADKAIRSTFTNASNLTRSARCSTCPATPC